MITAQILLGENKKKMFKKKKNENQKTVCLKCYWLSNY